jgi:hypothetical protein
VVGAGASTGAAGVGPVAIERMRALPGVDVTDVVIAGVAIITPAVVGHADSANAIIASCLTARAIRPVVDADMVFAALATRAVRVDAAPVRRDADVIRATFRRRAFTADITGCRVATRGRATSVAAAIRQIDGAAFLGGFTPGTGVRAAQLFAIALAVTAGVIATLAVIRIVLAVREDPRHIVVAACGPSPRVALRQAGGTRANPTNRYLVARAFDRHRSGCRPASRVGASLQHRSSDGSCPAQPKESLEQGATTGAAGR